MFKLKNLGKCRFFSSNNEKYYILSYDYVPDIINLRVPHRPNHLKLAQSFVESGKLIAGGAFNPPNGAQLIFKSNKEVVDDFIKKDPYVINKLVTNYDIKEWTVAIGSI
jgi:uncharacterized protein YciI